MTCMTIDINGKTSTAISDRRDILGFVTINSYNDTAKNTTYDRPCLVTYALDAGARGGLFRTRQWLKLNTGNGKLEADGAAESPASEVYPLAQGFRVRWYRAGGNAFASAEKTLFTDPDPTTVKGAVFYTTAPDGTFHPAALEISVYLIEAAGKRDSGTQTLVKVFRVPTSV